MIVAGTEAAEGKFPYQVRLYSSIEDDGGFCGGSLIAPQWVLTASHCVTKGDLNGGPKRRQTPRTSQGLNGKADVALIKLKTPVAGPKTVPIRQEISCSWREGHRERGHPLVLR
jgi:hypothetical protein